ncbi:gliding motility-associated C-terminal domain-containing protein, partial [Mucilaginibacter sp.]
EAKGYDNATKSFDGHSSTNGKLQQPGTYFYSLEYKDGNETKHKTGFIVLKY